MGTFTMTDGTEISYQDRGAGRPVVFSHGRPLNADAAEAHPEGLPLAVFDEIRAGVAADRSQFHQETDFTEDPKRFDIPARIIHGDDDQIVPLVAAGQKSVKLVEDAAWKVYPAGAARPLGGRPGPGGLPRRSAVVPRQLTQTPGTRAARKNSRCRPRTRGPLGRHRLERCRDYLRWPLPQPPFSQPSLKTGPT